MKSSEQNLPGAWRALPILVLLYGLSILDRQVLTLMVGPIKSDLGLTDLQIGLLQGLVFSIFYSVASIPIGWLVDRSPRRPIIWVGVSIWAACAAACGLAQNFGQLLVARLGVGAGEAALAPAAYSMLADLFRPSRLAFALSVLLVGSTLGNGLAVAIGGSIVAYADAGHVQSLPFIGEIATWQYVFIVTGAPGLVLGALIFLVREPVRRDRRHAAHPPMSATLQFMAERRGFFACHFIGFGLLAVVGWGFTSWLPTYMIRTYGWTISQLTLPLALILGLGSSAGVLTSGWIVDKMFAAGRTDAHMRVYAAIALLVTVAGLAAFQMHDPWMFLLLAIPVAAAIPLGAIAAAALQIVSPNEMRGQIGAIFLLVSTGLGMGLGPPLAGFLTDVVFRDEGRLGSSLTLMFAVLGPMSALTLWLGLRHMREAVSEAEAWRTVSMD